MLNIIMIGLLTWFTGCLNSGKVAAPDSKHIEPLISFYDLKAISLEGESIDMNRFKGKKIVILNVASKCGYTSQYADWQNFYDQNLKDFVILGFPCNQFLGQEPGSNDEIAEFCQKNYGVTFQMFDKVDVKGENQHEIYKWLSDPNKNGWNDEIPSWNFSKYLVDENGKLLNYFGPKIKPDSPEFLSVIKK